MKNIIGILAIMLLIGTISATNSTQNYTINATQANVLKLQAIVNAQNTIIGNLINQLINDSNTIKILKINISDNYQSIYSGLNSLNQGAISRSYLANYTANLNKTNLQFQNYIYSQFSLVKVNLSSQVNESLDKANRTINNINRTFDNLNNTLNMKLATQSNSIVTNNAIFVATANQLNTNIGSGDQNDLYIALAGVALSIIAIALVIRGGREPKSS